MAIKLFDRKHLLSLSSACRVGVVSIFTLVVVTTPTPAQDLALLDRLLDEAERRASVSPPLLPPVPGPANACNLSLSELRSELSALTESLQRGRAELAPITNAADRLVELSRTADPIDGCPQHVRDDLRGAHQQLSGLDLPGLRDRSGLQMQCLVSKAEEVGAAQEDALSRGDTERAQSLNGQVNQVAQWDRQNTLLHEELETLVRRQTRYLESLTDAQVRCAASEF